jgi:hypothetical protein
MYEVKVRDIPARSLLCLLRHASSEQEVSDLGKEVIGMLKAQPTPRQDRQTAAQSQLLDDSFLAWAAEQQRQPGDLPLRVTILTTAAPVTDASKAPRH